MESAETINRLNTTEGHIVAGVSLDGHRFLGRMKAAQLMQVAQDPRRTEDEKQVAADASLSETRKVREMVQRLFEGAKERNVGPYADYLVAVHNGQNGMAPPIILFTKEKLSWTNTPDAGGQIQIPYGTMLIAIDGETQLAARFEAASKDPATQSALVPVMICHGLDLTWARQVFHDLNLLGVRPNAAVGISMDARDPATGIARTIEQEVPFFKDRVNTVRRQLRRSDKHVVTITALRGACVTLAEGIGGVKHGAKPVAVAGDPKHLAEVAKEWFRAVADAIGPAIELREQSVASAPAVLAAIGAMGHALVNVPSRQSEMKKLIDELKAVDWDKGEHWNGIAGKLSPSGKLSIGGSKETAYAVYRALTDATQPNYQRIRARALVTA
jgi:DGQHR domain-containing protein